MKYKNKEVNVKGLVYNDASQQMRPCNFNVICSNDEKGKTLSIDNGLLQYTIPFEPIAKYFEGNYKKQ
jgi:hypothetical protein